MRRWATSSSVAYAAAVLGAALALAAPARAGVYLRQNEALALAFPGARTERRTAYLTDEQARQVQQRAHAKLTSQIVTYYPAFAGDSLLGVAFFDTRTVRTMPATLMIVVAPDTTARRVEVLAFHEPEDYRPPPRWLALLDGRRAGSDLWPRRGLPNLGGATLTAHTVTESVRLALALYALVDRSAPRARATRDAP